MRIVYTDATGRDRSRLIRALIELHYWLPERFAEAVSWRAQTLMRRMTKTNIKWSKRIIIEGPGPLHLRGDVHIAAGTRFFVNHAGMKIGPKFKLDHGATLLAYGEREVTIGTDVYIGTGAYIDARGGLRIGDGSGLGPGAKLITFNHAIYAGATDTTLGITIGRLVWIGANAVVLDGVSIGDRAVVAAGAVVTSDVAPYTVVAGVPARPVREVVKNTALITGDGDPITEYLKQKYAGLEPSAAS